VDGLAATPPLEELEVFIGGGPPSCDDSSPPPHLDMLEFRAEVPLGWSTNLLFCGFAPGESVDISVRSPDGELVEAVLDDESAEGLGWQSFWLAVPGDPLGTHTVVAAQGGLEVPATFDVVAPGGPTVLALRDAAPGGTVPIAIAGLTPGEPAAVDVYQELDRSEMFALRGWFSVVADDQGNAFADLSLRDGAPVDDYAATVRGEVEGFTQFSLVETPIDVPGLNTGWTDRTFAPVQERPPASR